MPYYWSDWGPHVDKKPKKKKKVTKKKLDPRHPTTRKVEDYLPKAKRIVKR